MRELFLRWRTDNDLGYDAKISSRREGALAYYSTTSNWNDHVHVEVDKNGNETYSQKRR